MTGEAGEGPGPDGEGAARERVGVIGAGYVGLVTGVCLAAIGYQVTLRDIDANKVAALNDGQVPIYEPGLAELMAEHAERLTYTLSLERLLTRSDILFIAVDTPPTYSGDADLSRVMGVIDELERVGADPRHVLVMKSTVPVGTGERVRAELDARGMGHVGYCSNPEFLKEGAAIEDFLHPDRVVIGSFDAANGDRVEALYTSLGAPIVRTTVPSAEMVKYASNAFLATKISFINEIANVCEEVGADVAVVAHGMGLDGRIGRSFLRAGIGFGGAARRGETVVVRRGEGARLVASRTSRRAGRRPRRDRRGARGARGPLLVRRRRTAPASTPSPPSPAVPSTARWWRSRPSSGGGSRARPITRSWPGPARTRRPASSLPPTSGSTTGSCRHGHLALERGGLGRFRSRRIGARRPGGG